MRADLELVIGLAAGTWTARGRFLTASGKSLAALDENIRKEILASGRFEPDSQVVVWMGCDTRMIPAWMRPYQSHYFNRVVTMHL